MTECFFIRQYAIRDKVLSKKYLGVDFSLTRWLCSLIGIILIAGSIDRKISTEEKRIIYAKHRAL